MCDYGWDEWEARVVCRQLGFNQPEGEWSMSHIYLQKQQAKPIHLYPQVQFQYMELILAKEMAPYSSYVIVVGMRPVSPSAQYLMLTITLNVAIRKMLE